MIARWLRTENWAFKKEEKCNTFQFILHAEQYTYCEKNQITIILYNNIIARTDNTKQFGSHEIFIVL